MLININTEQYADTFKNVCASIKHQNPRQLTNSIVLLPFNAFRHHPHATRTRQDKLETVKTSSLNSG